jgi:putative ABC transport system permease protein
MLKSYWRIAWRILFRQKLFSLVNVMGLAIGMAACLLITQYIIFEVSYDNFHRNGANIYRIKHQNYSQGNLIENLPYTYSAVGPALKSEFPQVREATRVGKMEGMVAAPQPNGSLITFNEKNLYQVDASFLKVFTFPMQSGSDQALAAPNSVVITPGTAKKYFPNQDPIAKPSICRNKPPVPISRPL